MADWEALFAQASDIPTPSNPPISSSKRSNDDDWNENPNGERANKKNIHKKSRKKHKRQRTSSHGSNSSAYQEMLKSRLDPPPGPTTPWFSWMTLEQSFLDGRTATKEPQEGSSDGLSFRLILSNEQQDSQQESWHLQLFCHCRNLRCCAKLLARWDTRDDDSTMKGHSTHKDQGVKGSGKPQTQRRQQRQKHQKSLFRNMQHEANEIIGMTQSFLGYLPNDEANLLISKASEATGLVEKLLLQRKRESHRSDTNARNHVPSWSWEPCIRIIMACDALYYRLYYQQLTGRIGSKQEMRYIPHPQFYFGLEGLTMESHQKNSHRKSSRLLQTAQEWKDYSSPELGTLMDHLVVQDSGDKANHPLEAIHRHRFQETLSLFQDSGWASSPNTLWKKSFSQQQESQHETPAPQLLMDWRDSSRDFLCHLYAYATVSSKVLQQLGDLLAQVYESMDLSRGIVEIGAGTGYLAEVLRGQGMTVEAWDSQPTTSSANGENNRGGMNEYHGHVPPFCDVQKASTFPSSSADAKGSALLLCYPPPESPMALNTLSAYRKAGGRCLIHIGEFKGLTGDLSFEKALLREMQCIARHPCLGWGTDAAYLTVWITKGSSSRTIKGVPTSSSVLLPCSAANCCKEATWRCRPLRHLVYCSKECYDAHASVRNCLFSLFNVHIDANLTSFGSSKAFAPL